jgi:hypothetical protein
MKYMRILMVIWIGLLISYTMAPSSYASNVPEGVQNFAKGQGLDEF